MRHLTVKICGITRLEDALYAAECGADMLGLNFYPKSKRYISVENARRLVADVRAQLGERSPRMVGVFVNETAIQLGATAVEVGLDLVQLSGDESVEVLQSIPKPSFRAIRPADVAQALRESQLFAASTSHDPRAPSLLLDAYRPGEYGGTGHLAADPVALAVKGAVPRLMLAGGLTPENVAERVAAIQPWGVDVASGVEGDNPGMKDQTKIRAFIEAARSVGLAEFGS